MDGVVVNVARNGHRCRGSSIDLAVRGHRVDIVLTPHLPVQGEPVGGRRAYLLMELCSLPKSRAAGADMQRARQLVDAAFMSNIPSVYPAKS
jgi:hypothetical protein